MRPLTPLSDQSLRDLRFAARQSPLAFHMALVWVAAALLIECRVTLRMLADCGRRPRRRCCAPQVLVCGAASRREDAPAEDGRDAGR